jgi:hypothetical protein
MIWYNTIDAFPTWCTHFLRLRLSFKNEWRENDRNLTDIFQFLCRSRAPLAGSQNCAVLLNASDPGGPTGLRNGHLARQKHDFGSVELHLQFQETRCKITITMLNDTWMIESCFIMCFISLNLQFLVEPIQHHLCTACNSTLISLIRGKMVGMVQPPEQFRGTSRLGDQWSP